MHRKKKRKQELYKRPWDSPFSLVTHVLPVGGGMLVEEWVLWRCRGGQVKAPVAVVAAAVVVLLLHVSICHLLPQLLQLGWNHA